MTNLENVDDFFDGFNPIRRYFVAIPAIELVEVGSPRLQWIDNRSESVIGAVGGKAEKRLGRRLELGSRLGRPGPAGSIRNRLRPVPVDMSPPGGRSYALRPARRRPVRRAQHGKAALKPSAIGREPLGSLEERPMGQAVDQRADCQGVTTDSRPFLNNRKPDSGQTASINNRVINSGTTSNIQFTE